MGEPSDALKLAGKRVAEQRLVLGRAGNLSVRLADGRVLITARGSKLGELADADLVVVDSGGKKISGEKEPSTETPTHLEIYKARPDVTAVVHTHSTYATVLAFQKKDLKNVNPEVELVLGQVGVAAEHPHGTPELGRAVVTGLVNGKACLVEKHGVFAIGSDVEAAVEVAELVEHTAKMTYLIDLAGLS